MLPIVQDPGHHEPWPPPRTRGIFIRSEGTVQAHPKPRPLQLVALPPATPWPPLMGGNLRFLRRLDLPAPLAERLALISALAQLPLEDHVDVLQRVPVYRHGEAGVAYRLSLQDMQKATAMPLRDGEQPPNTQNWPVLLMHSTDFRGLLAILRERRIGGVPVAEGGTGEHGAYFLGKVGVPPTDTKKIRDTFQQAWCHGKNVSGVILECWSAGPWERWTKDSTTGEQERCAAGVSVHLRRNLENRWCIAVPYITMRAMWLLDTSLEGLERDAVYGRWVMERGT